MCNIEYIFMEWVEGEAALTFVYLEFLDKDFTIKGFEPVIVKIFER